MVMVCNILVLIILFGICILIICGKDDEKKEWNNGRCVQCGTKWVQVDMDSQGGRLYSCGCNKGHHCWINYNADKTK